MSSSKGAVGVRFFYIMESAAENEFVHVETRLGRLGAGTCVMKWFYKHIVIFI